MNQESLTPEQKEALAALENQSGEWGLLAKALGNAQVESVPSLSADAVARLEAIRNQSLASVGKKTAESRKLMLQTAIILRIAAILVVLGTLTWLYLPRQSPNAEIAITSPRGDTTSTVPVINWQAKPGKSYDVWILPPEGDVLTVPAVFKAEKVRPPVDFAALKPGKDAPLAALKPGEDYRVLVCYADTKRIGGIAIAFHVSPKPHSP